MSGLLNVDDLRTFNIKSSFEKTGYTREIR
jgi:hypothetical protein